MADERQTGKSNGQDDAYFPINPLLIRNWNKGRFSLHLRQGDSYVLYTHKGDAFTENHRDKLQEMGINQVFVRAEEKADYTRYLMEHLDDLLQDKGIPTEHRAQAWYQASVTLTQRVFQEKLPKAMNKKRFKEISELLRISLDFFGQGDSLRHVAKLIGRGYRLYNHSLGTAVLTTFVAGEFRDADKKLLHAVGIGSLLHDIGKTEVSAELLERDPSTLSVSETEQVRAHAAAGVGLLLDLPLPPEAQHCILFHHEKVDGTGYPSGLTGEHMPFYVKALAVCNVYDNLTRAAPWRPARTPFDALRYIKANKDGYDITAIRKLINVLSGAELT